MAEKKIYKKTKVVVSDRDYNEETKKYSSEVQTNYYKTLPFTLEIYEKPEVKTRDGGEGVIIGVIDIASKQVSIRERENQYGKSYGGTIIAKEFYVNVEQVLSRSENPSYEVSFSEVDFWDEAKVEGAKKDEDLPF